MFYRTITPITFQNLFYLNTQSVPKQLDILTVLSKMNCLFPQGDRKIVLFSV